VNAFNAVHRVGPAALAEACECDKCRIQKLVMFTNAGGANELQLTETKLTGLP